MASYWVRKPKNSLGKRLLLEGLTGSDTASGHVIFPTSDTLRHIRKQVMLCMTYVDCQLRQVALVSPLEAVRGHWSQFEAIWGVRGCCQNNSIIHSARFQQLFQPRWISNRELNWEALLSLVADQKSDASWEISLGLSQPLSWLTNVQKPKRIWNTLFLPVCCLYWMNPTECFHLLSNEIDCIQMCLIVILL